jgi:hypothetical protein
MVKHLCSLSKMRVAEPPVCQAGKNPSNFSQTGRLPFIIRPLLGRSVIQWNSQVAKG